MFSFIGRPEDGRFAGGAGLHVEGDPSAAVFASPPGAGLLQPLIDADLADTPGVLFRLALRPHFVLIKPEQGIAGELVAQAAGLETSACSAPAENTAFAYDETARSAAAIAFYLVDGTACAERKIENLFLVHIAGCPVYGTASAKHAAASGESSFGHEMAICGPMLKCFRGLKKKIVGFLV